MTTQEAPPTRQIIVFRRSYAGVWTPDDLLVTFPADATVIWEAGQGCVSIRTTSGSVLAAYRGATGFRDTTQVTDSKPESSTDQEQSALPQP